MNRSQKKTLRILVAVLVILVAVLLIVLGVKHYSAQKAEEEQAAQDAAQVITEEQTYTALTYDNGTATLSFVQDEEGNWVWADDADFPLDDATVTAILDLLSSLKPQQTITEGDTLESYGLDEPFATLTATASDGSTLTIALGNTTTDGDSYYMLMNGQESPVYIIADTLYQYMSTGIYDMCILPELPTLSEGALHSVTIEGAATTALTAQTTESEETGSDGGTETTVSTAWSCDGADVTDNEDVQSLISGLETLSISKCVDFKPTDEAAAICGFDDPVVLTVTYQTEEDDEEQTFRLSIGTESVDGTGYYVRLEGDSTIYQVPASAVETLVSVAANGLGA